MEQDKQDKIVLWRGDIKKINRFSMQKVDKESVLVGPGIYLTDNIKVAESYRTKGKYSREYNNATADIVLFSSKNSMLSRVQMLEVGFEGFVAYKWQQLHPGQKLPEKHEKEWGVLAKSLRIEWRMLVKTGRIITESQGHSFFKSKNRKFMTCVTMHINADQSLGHLSRFVFNRNELEGKILNIGIPITDRRVLRILYEKQFLLRGIVAELRYKKLKECSKWDSYVSFKEYCEEMQYAFISMGYNEKVFIELDKEVGHLRTIYTPDVYGYLIPGTETKRWSTGSFLTYQVFIEKLKAIGYCGFEYSGGSYTNSRTKHRAFSIWDENFVNAHRVDFSH